MLSIYIFCFVSLFGVSSQSDEKPLFYAKAEGITVIASRCKIEMFNSPYIVDLIEIEDIKSRLLARNLPEIFSEEPSIMVQKTGQGQGSPFIRGFTGFRTLFLIDGIRLNNSVFREGPNQYWNTVDPLMLERVEVLKGPGSVLYGSDAIGGAVNAITSFPEFFEEGWNFKQRIYYRYASADLSNIGRLEFDGNYSQKFGFHSGISIKKFNDVVAGREVGLQPKTGYDEIDGDLKMLFFVKPNIGVSFGYQHTDQDDIWRTHKTIYGISWKGTSVGDEKERKFDQNRDLVYLQLTGENIGKFMKDFKISLSYHIQKEEQSRVKRNDESDIQGFDVKTPGFWSQITTPSPIGDFTYGFELYRDYVNSFKRNYLSDGTLDEIEIQGPVADDSYYDLIGIFLQDKISFSEKLDAFIGGRYTIARVNAQKVENPTTGNQISLSDKWDNIAGNFRLIYFLNKNLHFFSGVSQGFRAPNLSDLTRFDIARSNEIETPSLDLEPENFITYEAGIKSKFSYLQGELSYFFTSIYNMIVRYPSGDTVEGNIEVKKANVGEGFLHGFESKINCNLLKGLSFSLGVAWQLGEVDTYPTSEKIEERKPMSRIPPLSGLFTLRWNTPDNRYWIEGVLKGADNQNRLSPEDEKDTQRIPPGGTPGYVVFSLRQGIKANKNLIISTAVENITNEDYRLHGSGQNEAGTSLILSVDWEI